MRSTWERLAMQATPGGGYSGTLSFSCSGLPLGTTCATPSVALASGSTSNFLFTVTTSGSAAATSLLRDFPLPGAPVLAARLLLVFIAFWLSWMACTRPRQGMRQIAWRAAVGFVCLAIVLSGCGGGGSLSANSAPPPAQIVTPSGTYTITVTPSATASGSNKAFPLSPLNLTLIVK